MTNTPKDGIPSSPAGAVASLILAAPVSHHDAQQCAADVLYQADVSAADVLYHADHGNSSLARNGCTETRIPVSPVSGGGSNPPIPYPRPALAPGILETLLRMTGYSARCWAPEARLDIDSLDPGNPLRSRVADDQADYERERVRNGEGSL